MKKFKHAHEITVKINIKIYTLRRGEGGKQEQDRIVLNPRISERNIT